MANNEINIVSNIELISLLQSFTQSYMRIKNLREENTFKLKKSLKSSSDEIWNTVINLSILNYSKQVNTDDLKKFLNKILVKSHIDIDEFGNNLKYLYGKDAVITLSRAIYNFDALAKENYKNDKM